MKLKTREYRAVGALGILLAALCIAGTAHGATVTYGGTNPTKNTDGTDIPATGPGSLTQLRLEYGTCLAGGAFGTKAGEITRTSPAAGANFTGSVNLQPGTSCLRILVQNTYGSESDPSNVTTRVVDAPKPMPPVLTSVAPQVYDVRPNESTFAFDRGRQVGTVKLGAACDEDRHTDADWYALERPSRVKLTREPRSTALVARCGAEATALENSAPSAVPNPSSDVHLDDGGGDLIRSRVLTASR